MVSLEVLKEQYREIYELICGNPRVYVKTVAKKLRVSPDTASKRMKEAFDNIYVTNPQIRKRSYSNIREYVYFVKAEKPTRLYKKYIDNIGISYHAEMKGFADLWMISNKEIQVEGDVILQGLRSDYYQSFAPNHLWDKARQLMQEKVGNFDPAEYVPQGNIKTHWDETIEWSPEYENLYREFKYNFRSKISPIMRKHHISGEKTYKWIKNISDYCTVLTSYFPEKISSYDAYLFMVETDYEDFLIDLFSELPTTSSFFKVSNKLFMYVHAARHFVRSYDRKATLNTLYIPLLMEDLLEKGILKSEASSIVQFSWGKDL